MHYYYSPKRWAKICNEVESYVECTCGVLLCKSSVRVHLRTAKHQRGKQPII